MGKCLIYNIPKSEPFYDFFLVDHIADKDVYNHVIVLIYTTGTDWAKTLSYRLKLLHDYIYLCQQYGQQGKGYKMVWILVCDVIN